MVRNEDLSRIDELLGRTPGAEDAKTPQALFAEISQAVLDESGGNAVIDDEGNISAAPGSNVLYREEMLSQPLRELLRRYREVNSYLFKIKNL